jgi:hypothetical protein
MRQKVRLLSGDKIDSDACRTDWTPVRRIHQSLDSEVPVLVLIRPFCCNGVTVLRHLARHFEISERKTNHNPSKFGFTIGEMRALTWFWAVSLGDSSQRSLALTRSRRSFLPPDSGIRRVLRKPIEGNEIQYWANYPSKTCRGSRFALGHSPSLPFSTLHFCILRRLN